MTRVWRETDGRWVVQRGSEPELADAEAAQEALLDMELAQLTGSRTVKTWTPAEEAAEIERRTGCPLFGADYRDKA